MGGIEGYRPVLSNSIPAAMWAGSSTTWLKTRYVDTTRTHPIRVTTANAIP